MLEAHSKPGETTETHSHPACVGIGITDGRYKFTLSDGEGMEIELKAGEAVFLEAVEHTTENIGTTEARAILVELK